MYRRGPFVEDDPGRLSAVIRDFPLATLVVCGDEGLCAAYAPLIAECGHDGRVTALIGHVARANPFWSAAGGREVLTVFSGPDGYVSPSYYPAKQEHGRVVPTWNYVRVQAKGVMRTEPDPKLVRPYFETLTLALEQGRIAPWRVDDAPADYVEALGRGIVGLRLEVAEIQGVFKLSQNKTAADHAGVRDGLVASPHPREQAVGRLMPASE